jgi:hypothetical protein
MVQPSPTRRFKINPVEVGIFSVVALIFVNSVYNLFYEVPTLSGTPLAQVANTDPSDLRAPASQSFFNVDIKCEGVSAPQETQASKVRLSGPLCGSDQKADLVRQIKMQIQNVANKYAATVFTDVSTGRFSTDYIPLNAGKNSIHVEFQFPSGQNVT